MDRGKNANATKRPKGAIRALRGQGASGAWADNAKMTNQVTSQTSLLIVGMKCNRCRELVAEALEVVTGVNEVHVDLYRGQAMIGHGPQCVPQDLAAAVERAGYGASCVSVLGAGRAANASCPICGGQSLGKMKGAKT